MGVAVIHRLDPARLGRCYDGFRGVGACCAALPQPGAGPAPRQPVCRAIPEIQWEG
jgi:hypothetical protein